MKIAIAGPLVVSCGSQHSESLVVVEPGGHVGRLPLSLSTCPRGAARRASLGVGVEALFTSALGLQPPWVVEGVKLDVPSKRIDFEVSCAGALLSCPACGAASQPVHDRLRRSWRHLDFFQFEAWLHADVPRIACGACGKTTQLSVPWARAGSGFTAAFEALALALCRELPVRQAAALLRCKDKQLWRRIELYVDQARALESFAGVQTVGIDETSLRRGQHYITVVHDLDAKRLLFAAECRDHQTVLDFAVIVTVVIVALTVGLIAASGAGACPVTPGRNGNIPALAGLRRLDR